MKRHSKEIDFKLRIIPNEVLRRIAETSDLRKFELFESGSKPFTYTVSGNEINIQKRITYRNDFRSSLFLKVEPTNYGSKLRGRFSMGIVPIIFLTGWLIITGGLSLFSVIGIFRQMMTTQVSFDNLFPNFIPILMFLGGVALFGLASFSAKSEEREISEWLNNLFADSIIKH